MSHTPGPWQIGFDDGSGGLCDGAYIISQDGSVVVRGGSPEGDLRYGVQSDDDAPLISAAPDFLEACKIALDSLRMGSTLGAPILERAIAKAEGKQ